MFSASKSRAVLALTDLLGLLALGFGLVFAIYGFATGYRLEGIYGAALASGGLTWLVVGHMGRALVQIAETNAAILAKLSEK